MTREAMLNHDAMSPKFIKYNPCYYCKKTTTCRMECIPRIGFISILSDRLEHFYKDDADEQAISKMKENAQKYGLPLEHEQTQPSAEPVDRPSAYEKTRAAVYATGNRWAIENFHATHD